MALLVTNARLLDPARGGETPGSMLVVDGKVAALGDQARTDPRAAGAEVLDAHGHLLCPGLIDLHVHFREPGQTGKESIETGSMAAETAPKKPRAKKATSTEETVARDTAVLGDDEQA